MFWEATYNTDIGSHVESGYNHAIWAENEERARSLADIFEFQFFGPWPDHWQLPAEFRPSKYLLEVQKKRQRSILRRPELLHAVTFLSFLGVRAKVAAPDFFLNDTSPLHELVHYCHFGNPLTVEHVIDRLLTLEKMIPGLPPESVELPRPTR
jgi:hypothetical protein